MSGADPREAAQRSLARAAAFASFSGWVMLVLGALSLLVSLRAPVSASFAISAAVVVNGWIELRFGRRLRSHDPAAPRWLAGNQLALGIEVAAYILFQSQAFGPGQIENVLRRPSIRQILSALDPEAVRAVVDMLPETLRLAYFTVGVLALAGCIAAAAYYASRARCLRILAASASSAGATSTVPSDHDHA